MGEKRTAYRILRGKAERKETTGNKKKSVSGCTILKWILER
jgi:hypothetical protein